MTGHSTTDNSLLKLFETTLQEVQGQFDINRKDTSVGLKLLSKFDELKKYRSIFVHKVTELKGQNGSFILLLVEKHLTIIEHRRGALIEKEIDELEPILIFTIPHDIGKVFIRKETTIDKVIDLFTKVDIDFAENPNFSKNYLVIGDSPDLVRSYLPKGLMDSLEKIKNMTIEINGNWGLIRPERNLSKNVLLLLLSIGYKMTK
jgi:hypothetical protein